jgi:short-subunit dehydrogenase
MTFSKKELKIAWVTGASGFWGRKTSMSLLRNGWHVIALSRSEPQGLAAWADAQTAQYGCKLEWYPFDWEDSNWKEGIQALSTPQAFFHCSGIFDADLSRMLTVNVSQPIELMTMLIEGMTENEGGQIGVYLGQNGRLGLPGLGSFSATQGALWTWSEATQRKLRKEKSPVSLTLVFPKRAPSQLQSHLAQQLVKSPKLKPVGSADQLVRDVLKCRPRAGRRPLAAGLLTLIS